VVLNESKNVELLDVIGGENVSPDGEFVAAGRCLKLWIILKDCLV
jgi:hypothetical protein